MFLKPVRLIKCLTFRASKSFHVRYATFWRYLTNQNGLESEQENFDLPTLSRMGKRPVDQQIECGIYKKPENLLQPFETIGITTAKDQGRVRVAGSRDKGFKIGRVELIQNIQSKRCPANQRNNNDKDRFEDWNNDELLLNRIIHPMTYRSPPNIEGAHNFAGALAPKQGDFLI